MKQVILIIAVICLSNMVTVRAQQHEIREVKDFNKVILKGAVDVFFIHGDSAFLEIETRNIPTSYVESEVHNNELVIWSDFRMKPYRAKVFLNYVNLEEIVAKGAGDIHIESKITQNDFILFQYGIGDITFQSDVNLEETFCIEMHGPGDLKFLKEIHCADLTIKKHGAGDVNLDGLYANELNLNINGPGDFTIDNGEVEIQIIEYRGLGDYEARNLKSERCILNKSSIGDLHIYVEQELTGDVRGVGEITCKGQPDRCGLRISMYSDFITRN